MNYKDKNNKKIVLTPVKGEYLIKFKAGFDGEGLIKNLSQTERFKSAKWIPKDNLVLVTYEKEAEKTEALKNVMGEMESAETVEAVIPVFRDEEGFKRLVVPNQLLVAYKPGLKESLVQRISEQYSILEQSRYGNWLIIELTAEIVLEKALKQFGKFPEVQYCEPVYYGVNDTEEDSGGVLRWNLNNININDAWAITKGAPEIAVAVIDGKPDIAHPALSQVLPKNLPEEWEFSSGQPSSSHSTQILSILAGQSAELQGIAPGICLMPLVVNLDAQHYHQRADAIHYLRTVMENGSWNNQPLKRIIANCSWKTSGDVGVIREAIQEAATAGVIFVTSAGNDNTSGPHYPSDYSNTIKGVFSVAALAPTDRKAEYSNYSATVTVSAPGGAGMPLDLDDIYCADLNQKFSYAAGTSYAAPHLAGVIALMLSVNPALDMNTINTIIVNTAEPLKEQNPEDWHLLGAGKLNAGAALNAIIAGEPISPDVPIEPTEPIGDEILTDPDVPGPNSNFTMTGSEILNMISCELDQLSQLWVAGSEIRITIESGENSVILNYEV